MEATEEAQISLPRRLNGRLAACDTCRARKVACDHTRPVCNRCRRKGRGSDCVYSEPEPRPSASRPPRRAPSASSLPRGEVVESGSGDGPTSTAQQLSWSASSKSAQERGYLGATSYSAVFEEARNSLSLLNAPDVDRVWAETAAGESRLAFQDLAPPQREMCLYVLRCLADHLSEEGELDDASLCSSNGWDDIATSLIISSLQTTFAQTHDQGEGGLVSIAEKISRNTTRALRDDVPEPEDWLDQFCGANLRWESVGLLCASMERASNVLHSIQCRRFDWLSKKYPPETVRTCLDYCVCLSRHFSEPNTLLLDIWRRKSALESSVHGEASKSLPIPDELLPLTVVL